MTFSQEQYQAATGGNEALPTRLRSYFKQRFQQRAFARLAKAYAQRAEETGLTKSRLATMLGRDKAQINRLLAHPSNMTLDVYSDLALALNFEPEIRFLDLSEDPRHNFVHHAYNLQTHDSRPTFSRGASVNSSSNIRKSTTKILEMASS